MRVRSVLGFVLCSAVAGAAFAADDQVVVGVGGATLTAQTLAKRLAKVPPFQLARYGNTPEAARKAYVDQALVPELLFAEEARARKLEERPRVQTRLRDALRDAMERTLRAELEAQVKPEEIKEYFEKNRQRFETPKRVRIWRILVADEAKANDIIAQAKGSDGPKRWSQLARDQSLDKATALRNGDLGFVRPDGSTDTPRVKVSPEIVALADKLADGAVADKPLREGENFAVVWRRGSMPEVKRTLEQEQASIRTLLERRKAEEARKALLDSLKKAGLKEQHPELLEHIDAQAFAGPPKRSPAKPARPEGSARRPKGPPASGERGAR